MSDIYVFELKGVVYATDDILVANSIMETFNVPVKYCENPTEFDKWVEDDPRFESLITSIA